MQRPDPSLPLAAGYAVIAAGLGLSLLAMLPLAAMPTARVVTWLAQALL